MKSDSAAIAPQFEIVAEASRTEAPLRAIKHGDTFALFDQHGDIVAADASAQGVFHDGTRFVSRFEIAVAGRRPLLLSSSVSDDNTTFSVDLTNPDITQDGQVVVRRGQIHFFRCIVLYDGRCHQRVRIANYGTESIELPLTIRFAADFADVFEVRGTRRLARGSELPTTHADSATVLRYEGLDRVERRTRIRWDRSPTLIDQATAGFVVEVGSRETVTFDVTIGCEMGPDVQPRRSYEHAFAARKSEVAAWRDATCEIGSSSESFNRWVARSESDLEMMTTQTRYGPYPFAGVPWFSTPFGRDGIITALELLWAQPDLARGVLSFLSATQATRVSDAQDAQPGKILHEMRGGEMAALGEVPFARYYGSIDATPLFVMLAASYYERTADRALIDSIWPNIVAAVDWIERYGDSDGDGFVEYARRSRDGLVQQGWKDSYDSVFHADGSGAEPPIALCEVQGYAYAAFQGAAWLASVRNDAASAERWTHRANSLRHRFDEAFWCEELGTYAIALDGQKAPCRVRSSNAAHTLFAGIARPDRAQRVAAALLSETTFGGWGVRTVDAGERGYNPMSYHNGSVWPHDNAIAAAGLSRYGISGGVEKIFGAMFDLSQVVDLHRLPELICGFHRRGGELPTLYPVACAPQTWAAGGVYLLLQSCLGLRIDAIARRITLVRPTVPSRLKWIRLAHLRVADASVELHIKPHGTSHADSHGEPHAAQAEVDVRQRRGDIEVVVET